MQTVYLDFSEIYTFLGKSVELFAEGLFYEQYDYFDEYVEDLARLELWRRIYDIQPGALQRRFKSTLYKMNLGGSPAMRYGLENYIAHSSELWGLVADAIPITTTEPTFILGPVVIGGGLWKLYCKGVQYVT